MAVAGAIGRQIIDAILSERLAPQTRLGEQELAALFGCSRTVVREAMVDLAARGIVTVSPRRGWYLAEVDVAAARELYVAREVIETGLLRHFARQGTPLEPAAIARLEDHLARQEAAVNGSDPARRAYLLGDFHVRLAEALGNSVLADYLRDLTVRTTLFTTRHQTPSDAHRSLEEHVAVIEALARGDVAGAELRMRHHLGTWEDKVQKAQVHEPLDGLRRALAPQRPGDSEERPPA